MTPQELRDLLKHKKMTQAELAEKLDVSRRTIERYCSLNEREKIKDGRNKGKDKNGITAVHELAILLLLKN